MDPLYCSDWHPQLVASHHLCCVSVTLTADPIKYVCRNTLAILQAAVGVTAPSSSGTDSLHSRLGEGPVQRPGCRAGLASIHRQAEDTQVHIAYSHLGRRAH